MKFSGYHIPSGPFRVEQKINKSLFIASCDHVSSGKEARTFHDRIKSEFSDATHNCFAFVAGPAGSTADNGFSDDGEPRGTAGLPMLNTLIHSGVGEIAVVVTRYYGGVKLGTGGLVRAYSGTVKRLLNELPSTGKISGNIWKLIVEYKDIALVKRLISSSGGDILNETFTDTITIEAVIPSCEEDSFSRSLPYDIHSKIVSK